MSDINNQKVTLIGAGRVATGLADALHSKGVRINEIYSRTFANAEKLSQLIPKATPTDSLDFSSSESSIFIVVISDDAIAAVSKAIAFPPDSILAHTSGSVSLSILNHPNSGIFYPLQTFTTKQKVDFNEVPILIEGKNTEINERLTILGQLISNHVVSASESERQQLHVAAVFASNFTNRMLAAAEEILKGSNLDISILAPLVETSIRNTFLNGPNEALTGPAKRGDQKTIETHLRLLEDHPQLKILYQNISDQILATASIKE